MDVQGGNGSHDLQLGTSFPFPFTPYDVQLKFMQNLYSVLQESKIGIFESPTGTGKSLSIICGALTWLRDFNLSRMKEMEGQLNLDKHSKENDADDWFSSFAQKKEEEEKLHDVKGKYDFLVKHADRIKALKKQLRKQNSHIIKNEDMFDELFPRAKRLRKTLDDDDDDELSNLLQSFKDKESNDDLELVLENYESDEEGRASVEEEEEEENHIVKIFYASRTHSQLSQFVGELQRSPFCDDVSVTVLGSRQNMCINQTVNKLKSLSLMNERCLELQKGKSGSKSEKSSKGSCPFYKQTNLKQMQDNILVAVKDIEQTVEVGKQLKACPYYATRHSIAEVEVVVLPYNTLLHKQTRDACGIKLKDNIVIIDEAHNLLEAINNIHSAEITGSCLHQAYCQLHQYQQRYYSRLNPKNLLYTKQLLYILSCLVKYMGGSVNSVSTVKQNFIPEIKMMQHCDFLSAAGVENINLFKIIRFCEQSQIGRKLHGFADKYQVLLKKNVSEDSKPKKSSISLFLDQVLTSKSDTAKTEVKSEESQSESADQTDFIASPFMVFVEFLRALTYPSKDGRVLVNKHETFQKSSLKFLLLNPAAQFESIATETRSVIVAGGTMQPFSEFTDQLFIPAGLDKEKIMCFSCDHVIPPCNLLAVSLSHGPSGNLLDFTYQKRNLPEVISDLGRVLINLTAVIPGGMVCFFPSYDYEQQVYSAWEKTGVIARLENRKKVFREPRKSSQVDKVLSLYSKCITLSSGMNKSQMNGALLLSIVGGKMSEGINFSNELGRCVVMVGLPYPNVNSPELKEKMDYLNKTVTSSCSGKSAGQVYYENLCMKAVNQSIGRAIRHKGDYATIVLVDSRYNRASVKDALPRWIATRLFSYPKFGQAFSAIRQFFIEKTKCL